MRKYSVQRAPSELSGASLSAYLWRWNNENASQMVVPGALVCAKQECWNYIKIIKRNRGHIYAKVH